MNINKLAREITLKEGKRVSLSIAQTKELLRILNNLSDGVFYKLVKSGIFDNI